MPTRRRDDTRGKILAAARDLAVEGGPALVTFDAIAKRVGVSKQAVIYWFPSKEALIENVALPAIREEAAVALAALAHARDGRDAIARFARAVANFHLADLDRFRLVYVAPQSGAWPRRLNDPARIAEHIHPVTAEMYAALERHLAGPDPAAATGARRTAVAIHMAVLGVVLMTALADAVGDPLRHAPSDLVESLIAALTAGRP